jgi:HlyD family secretion protein
MENLKVEMNRYKKLFDEQVVSAEKYDKARTDYKMALAQVKQTEEMLHLARKGPRQENIEQARAALRETKEKFKMVKKGPRAEKIDQASAKLAKAKASLSLAKTKLSYAEVVSPLTGLVISENIEAGEYVVPGTPIVTVGDLVNVWVRGYVDEEDLGRVKVGLNAQVTADTYPEKIYEGIVSFISSKAEFTPKSVQTQKERVKLVYRIKVEIRNTNMELKPGMPVDVNIILHTTPQ